MMSPLLQSLIAATLCLLQASARQLLERVMAGWSARISTVLKALRMAGPMRPCLELVIMVGRMHARLVRAISDAGVVVTSSVTVGALAVVHGPHARTCC